MNRRGFLRSMLKAGVAAMALPSAVTYARRWVKPAGVRFFIPQPIKVTWEIDWLSINSLSNCDIVTPSAAELEKLFAGGESFAELAPMFDAQLEAITLRTC